MSERPEPLLTLKVDNRPTGITFTTIIDPPRRLTGTAGRISWSRLALALKDAQEFRHDERITGLVIDENGIDFFTETRL